MAAVRFDYFIKGRFCSTESDGEAMPFCHAHNMPLLVHAQRWLAVHFCHAENMPFLFGGQRCISMFQQQNPYTKAALRNRKISAPAFVVSRSADPSVLPLVG
jgi:hypothetical protein